MKKPNLKLNKLQVKSFATSGDLVNPKTIKGGGYSDPGYVCRWHTHRDHNCSDIYCYSDFCGGTDPATDNCPV